MKKIANKRLDNGFTPLTRPWRTLIRLDSINEEAHVIGLYLPGWDPHRARYLNMSEIPEQVLTDMRNHGKDYRFFAYVNKGQPIPSNFRINFSTYETCEQISHENLMKRTRQLYPHLKSIK